MENANHTPGPWKAKEDYAGAMSVVSNVFIAKVGPPNTPMAQANARLIAAAPRMASALQRAAHILAELPRSEQTPQMLALRTEIIETIKQATPEYFGLAAAPETAAERDRLKEINAELLAALKDAHNELDILCSNIRATIAKAGGAA